MLLVCTVPRILKILTLHPPLPPPRIVSAYLKAISISDSFEIIDFATPLFAHGTARVSRGHKFSELQEV
jgi:hypothetical protein